MTNLRCPTCHSPAPHLHPAVQHEGEVHLCRDNYHNLVLHDEEQNPVTLQAVKIRKEST